MTSLELHADQAQALEQVVIKGDLALLSPGERVAYYRAVCESVGLNPYTQPLMYISLSGKLTLYARKDATDQLRRIHSVSVRLTGREMHDQSGLYVVTAQASLPSGRVDEAIGAVSVAGLKGENLANALMKCESKAKRRVTLSICGLGLLDETELPAGDSPAGVDVETGEIVAAAGLTRPSVAPPSAVRVLRPPPGATDGSVPAMAAKNELVIALLSQGVDRAAAKTRAAQVWGARGDSPVHADDLAAMLDTLNPPPDNNPGRPFA